MTLPFKIAHVGTPPIKCQGIKTKLIPFIFGSVCWRGDEGGRWIEPFLGSGVLALNLAPPRALLTDTNKHIIRFYQSVQSGCISGTVVREHLTEEGKKLESGGAYYYEVRDRFNEMESPLDFLFLNRSCFNGVMRFNRKGHFNVPFGHKPQRFTKAYITKIVNQVKWVAQQIQGKEWEFRTASWNETLCEVVHKDFVYLDPPYVGRHTDYYNSWDETEASQLSKAVQKLPCPYALSMWLENRYRKNEHIEQYWSEAEIRTYNHFYHVGSKETLRNEMEEALLIKPGFATMDDNGSKVKTYEPQAIQLSLAMEQKAHYEPFTSGGQVESGT